MALIDVSMARRQLNDLGTSTDNDELQMWVDAATSAVEKARGLIMNVRDFTADVDVVGGVAMLPHIPVVSLTSAESTDGSTTWDVGGLRVAASGAVSVRSGPPLRGTIAFAWTAGMVAPDANYKVAGLIILQHLWETRRGGMGPRHGGDDEVYVPQLGYAVPRRATELLGLSLPGVA